MNICSYVAKGEIRMKDQKLVKGHICDAINQSEEPNIEVLYDLSELFKVFGDSTRIKILYVLYESELCVCDIASLLSMTISAISHQLKILKQADLVKSRKSGRTVFYSLADNHVSAIISKGMEHITK